MHGAMNNVVHHEEVVDLEPSSSFVTNDLPRKADRAAARKEEESDEETDDESTSADSNGSIDDIAEMETPDRPKISYPTLIALTCKLTPSGGLRVKEIYQLIRRMYTYYRSTKLAWKNSVRHSLTHSNKFEKVPSGIERKGGKWRLMLNQTANMEKRIKKAFERGKIHPSVIDKIEEMDKTRRAKKGGNNKVGDEKKDEMNRVRAPSMPAPFKGNRLSDKSRRDLAPSKPSSSKAAPIKGNPPANSLGGVKRPLSSNPSSLSLFNYFTPANEGQYQPPPKLTKYYEEEDECASAAQCIVDEMAFDAENESSELAYNQNYQPPTKPESAHNEYNLHQL